MSTESPDSKSDANNWALPTGRLKVKTVPVGAVNLNVDGRQVTNPLQGFGPLWQRTYRVRLAGVLASAADVMKVWKAEFPRFHPPYNRFYPPAAGIVPGEIMLINTSPVLGVPPVNAGVMVMYVDDTSFAITTPEGFPEAGWNEFSAFVDEPDGTTVAQVQSMARAADPVYEIGFRLIGARQQANIWRCVLSNLAAHYGLTVAEADISVTDVCIDPRLNWQAARNVWQNAMIRSMLYSLARPVRWARRQLLRRE